MTISVVCAIITPRYGVSVSNSNALQNILEYIDITYIEKFSNDVHVRQCHWT